MILNFYYKATLKIQPFSSSQQQSVFFRFSGKEPASPDSFPQPASDTSERSNVSSLEMESFLKVRIDNICLYYIYIYIDR